VSSRPPAIAGRRGGGGWRAHTEMERRQDPLVEENDTSTERDPETAQKG
jgi:hypothetical protein